MLRKIYFFAFAIALSYGTAFAATLAKPSDYMSENAYNNLYPFMSNEMRTKLNPGVSPTLVNSSIDVLARPKITNATKNRRVVPRRRPKVPVSVQNNNFTVPHSAQNFQNQNMPAYSGDVSAKNTSPRRVVPRKRIARAATLPTSTNKVSRPVSATVTAGVSTPTVAGESMSSARCLADYTSCMNDYCEREDAPYNRCYCSAKLAQIDAEYQPEIDRLINQILTIKSSGNWTDEEMNEYWMERVGKYTGDNVWAKLDDALNIDWAATESRVRGQQAFIMGHEYCVQHLRACYYMAGNLRDAYRSEIARDCAAYENSLQRLKNAAESVIESFKQ